MAPRWWRGYSADCVDLQLIDGNDGQARLCVHGSDKFALHLHHTSCHVTRKCKLIEVFFWSLRSIHQRKECIYSHGADSWSWKPPTAVAQKHSHSRSPPRSSACSDPKRQSRLPAVLPSPGSQRRLPPRPRLPSATAGFGLSDPIPSQRLFCLLSYVRLVVQTLDVMSNLSTRKKSWARP